MTYKTGTELIEEARTRIREVTASEAMADESADKVYLDCREGNEWNLGHIPGAVFVPRGTLETKVEGIIPREKRVVIYCASGNRSVLAAETMAQMGYSDVSSMSGGFRGWVEAGGEVES